MGIKSTFDIDRQTAIAVIITKIHSCSNENLSNMLEEFEESHFRNYTVHDQLPTEPDEDSKTIRSVWDF